MLRADVAVYGEHLPCSGQAARSFGALSLGAAHLFPPQRAARVARGSHVLSRGMVRLFLRGEQPGQPEARVSSPRAQRAASRVSGSL